VVGTTVAGADVVIGAAEVLTGADVDSRDAAVLIADADLTDEAGLDVADSTADAVDSVAASTVAVAVASTVAVAAMAAGTGN